MSFNKLALIRYKTIDACLSNRQRKWTLDDLILKVSEAIYEYEGIQDGVSKRTIQLDIQTMRSDKLGYNAPIIVLEKKYYTYEDPKYSITKSKITNSDMEKMREIVMVLKQLSGFQHFEEMNELIAKLETNIYKSKFQGKSRIQFEGNKLVKGLDFLSPLYSAVMNETALLIKYQSFTAIKPQEGIYYPYLLKEHRNRWFLLAKQQHKLKLTTLALDRIIALEPLPKEQFIHHPTVNFESYYDNIIGVTKSESDKPKDIFIRVNKVQMPYVRTKPLHPSQELLKEDEEGMIIRIAVVVNFELERELLSFGNDIKVLGPRMLVHRIQLRANAMAELYK